MFPSDLRSEGYPVSVHRLHHVDGPEEAPQSIGADAFGALFKPLSFLLIEGGDSRLAITSAGRTNAYGCRPNPTPQTLAFSSSTATSISERAYRRAERARDELMEESIALGVLEAFDRQVERMRQSLRNCLALDRAEIVFSPSGTDTQLHALFFARQILGGSVTSIVVASEQTGSGTAYTSRGQNFSIRTSQGKFVEKGSLIEGLADGVESLGIMLVEVAGGYQLATRPENAIWIRKFRSIKVTSKLSRPALETLAIVAYRQPITRTEVEAIRGVNIGGVVRNLMERRLVKIVGKKDVPGKPMLYGTTQEFLQYFGLKDLSSLPTLKEFQELEADEEVMEEIPAEGVDAIPPEEIPTVVAGGAQSDPVSMTAARKNAIK